MKQSQDTPKIQKHFLSRLEAAEALSVSLPTISRRIADGSLPVARFGGRILVPIEALDQMAAVALGEAK